MEYRGYEFSVLQSASPRGWVWTVTADGHELRTGSVVRRAHATLSAQKAIENLIRAKAHTAARESA